MLIPTSHRVVELTNQARESVAIKWWEDNTARGAEGMVIKPHSFVARGPKGLVQPGVKCRGKEYRIRQSNSTLDRAAAVI